MAWTTMMSCKRISNQVFIVLVCTNNADENGPSYLFQNTLSSLQSSSHYLTPLNLIHNLLLSYPERCRSFPNQS